MSKPSSSPSPPPLSMDDILIDLPPNLTRSQLVEFPAFRTWFSTLSKSISLQHEDSSHPFHKKPYQVKSISVQSCDWFSNGSRLGFLKLKADVSSDDGEETLPGAVFMRGGSVAMLLILEETSSSASRSQDTNITNDNAEEYVILTVQPRIAAGSLGFIELPAGMLDDSGTFSGAAAKEIKEETGLEISEGELVDLTSLAIQARSCAGTGADAGDRSTPTTAASGQDDEEHLQAAMYPSPGGCDEFMPIFLARKEMSPEDIGSMKGKLTGLRDHGEKITLKICRLRDLWKVAARDGKTLAAVALYEGLKREGRI